MAVRREKVILEVEDHATNPLLRSAAAAKTLDKALDGVDRSSVRGSVGVDRISHSAVRADRDINKLTGRLRLFADLAAILGPSLIPIAAVGIPALTGLAAQFGAAAVAGGTALIAFQGVGDTLKAVNDAAIEPTAENLDKAREALSKLSPEAREFVLQIQEMRPAFTALRDAAASGLFPGLTAALDEAEASFDRIERVLHQVGEAAGGLAEDFAEGLTGPRGQEFLAFLETEVPSALTELGHTVANFTGGLAEMWMAFTPMNRDFSRWLLEASGNFDLWAQGLAQTDGFREFVDYIRTNGPRVADAMRAIGGALLDIVEAAAPLGGPVLAGLEAIANVISMIADSDLGTPIMAGVAAMSLYSRATSVAAAANLSFANTSLLSWKQTKGLGVAVGALALSMTDLDEKAGLPNTAMLAMAGTMLGPWGVAAGAATGFALDFAAANDEMEAAIRAVDSAFKSGTIDEQRAQLQRLATAADEAAAGFTDLAVAADERNPFAFGASVISASKFAFNILSGATRRAREEHERYLALLRHRKNFGAMLTGPLGEIEGAYREATGSALSFRDTVLRVNDVLSRRGSFRDYEASLDDLAAKLREVGDANLLTKAGKINISLPQGREVQAMLDNIAGSALAVAENLKGSGRVRFLARARKDFVDVAADLLNSRAAAKALADQLGLLDKKKVEPTIDADTKPAKNKIDDANSWLLNYDKKRAESTVDADNKPAKGKVNEAEGWLLDYSKKRPQATVDVNTGPARAGIAWINNALDQIPDETVFVNVQRRGGQTPGYGPQGAGYKGGGFTGWRRPDEAAGVVHGREFVFSEPATRGNVAMLDDLHRQLRGYANGGYVGSMPRATHNTSRTERLVERVVERLPETIVFDAGELGRIVIDTTDARIGDYRAHDSARAGTVYGGVGSD